jgi:tricorn protease-like protein/C-terminal processing protease CtpA/Prc
MHPTAARPRPSTALALLGAAMVTPMLAGADAIRPDATMLRFPDVGPRSIVFVYSNDLWVVPREGGTATRLADPAGHEMFPRFSPDGSTIAFVGNYEGNADLYALPAEGGGLARRLTHHPGTELLCDWTPGGELLFFASGRAGLARQTQLFTVGPGGGLPVQLPVPYGANGAVSPDGRWLAYTPHAYDFRTWKRYRGGMATDIWLFDLVERRSRRITTWEGTDTLPMWHGERVYYLADAGSEHRLNIWMYDTRSDRREQVTKFADYDVRFPSVGPGPAGQGEIVFQLGSHLHLLDLRSRSVRQVDVVIPGDRPTLRPRRVDFKDHIAGGCVSPKGKRAAVEARGEIWSLPAEKGVQRNMTRSSGIAERDPLWSPDGRSIAYASDATGEYEIHLAPSDGRGEVRRLTSDGHTFRMLLAWSPDSRRIAHGDKTGAVRLLDVETGTDILVATDPWADLPPVSFSQDSRWMALALNDADNNNGVIHVYDIEAGLLHPLTSPMFDSRMPAFDRKGDFLYFASSRRFGPTYSDIDTTFIYRDSQLLLAVPLHGAVKHPWPPESDEVELEKDAKDAKDADDGDAAGAQESGDDQDRPKDGADAPSGPILGTWEGLFKGVDKVGLPDPELAFTMRIEARPDGGFSGSLEVMGDTSDFDEVTFDEASGAFSAKSFKDGMNRLMRGTLADGALRGTWEIVEMGVSGEFEASRREEPAGGPAGAAAAKPVVIDLDGFEGRGLVLPVDPGRFTQVAVNDKNQVIYTRGGAGPEEQPSVKLFDIAERDKGERNVISGVFGFQMSPDGGHLGVQGPAGMAVVQAAPGQSLAKLLPTDRMKGTVDPRQEWRQLFVEAWRLQRDFFYDAGLHGVDWPAVRRRYEPMLEDCTTREDVAFVIGELIAELNVGHAYYSGGDLEQAPVESVGMLGCDFELAGADGAAAYRIARIHQGAPWDTDARGPLSQPGLDVKVGDHLLAVNGVPLDTAVDPWAAFVGLAGTVTEITVSDRPALDETARRVLVEPLADEGPLRYRAWVESKRRLVEERSGGRVGYIYVPNTGTQGQNELFRQFYGQRHKAGLIIDERWNGGGQIPTRFIELLNRPRTNYWAVRDGKDWPWPPDSHQGPKCMLINGLAGSGGDMFPALFRQAGLGLLIGTRTWGGLVGISGNPQLIDGGTVTVPTFGFYEKDGTWGIEGHGVDPDLEVIDDPALMCNGEDPQLEAAIAHILGEIERHPYEAPARPASPDRSGMGIRDADK